MKNSLWMKLVAPLLGVLALGLDASAQCPTPDGLDGGPCCTPAQPNVPRPQSFTQEAMQICWKDCDVENTVDCIAEWRIGSTNTNPCAIRRMTLTLRDAAGVAKWRGRFSVQYSRTWQEISPAGVPIQVWRYLANGDLRALPAAGPDPCPVPPCAFAHNRRVKFTGYIDMAKYCDSVPGTVPRREFSWMLTHGCDLVDHQPGFPRAGAFHPDRTYSFVGPAAGFVPLPLQAVEAGGSAVEAVRRVDLTAAGPPVCEYEEQIDFGIQPMQQFCVCGPTAAPAQYAVSNLGLGGACGTTVISGGPFLPGFISMSVGTWTDPTVYPGVEGLRWNCGGYDYDDPCTGITRPEVFFGVTTMRGYDAFTIPSVAGTVPMPLPQTFIDQCNALRSNTSVLNVPWKRSDHFLNLNLP